MWAIVSAATSDRRRAQPRSTAMIARSRRPLSVEISGAFRSVCACLSDSQLPAAGLPTNGWTWLGPGNIGGRVRAILVHPTSTNIMWCGGVDGGVWKTTNSGAAWFPLNDFMANLAISCMVMDPTNANIIYAGTGEFTYNADGIRGAGIF